MTFMGDEFEKAVGEMKVKDIVIGSIITGFGFLVALTWRDAINATVQQIVPDGSGLGYQYIAALIVTIVAVISGYILVRIQRANISRLASVRIIDPIHNAKRKKVTAAKTEKKLEKSQPVAEEKPASKIIQKKIVRVDRTRNK